MTDRKLRMIKRDPSRYLFRRPPKSELFFDIGTNVSALQTRPLMSLTYPLHSPLVGLTPTIIPPVDRRYISLKLPYNRRRMTTQYSPYLPHRFTLNLQNTDLLPLHQTQMPITSLHNT